MLLEEIAAKFSTVLNPCSTGARWLRPWQADLFAVAVPAATFEIRFVVAAHHGRRGVAMAKEMVPELFVDGIAGCTWPLSAMEGSR